jgi:hypothetical protein
MNTHTYRGWGSPCMWTAILVGLLLLLLTGNVESVTAQGPCAPQTNKPCDIPQEFVIAEGDIQVPPEWLEAKPEGTFNPDVALWPNGAVPYEFDKSATSANVASFPVSVTVTTQAIASWTAVANLTFTRCQNDACTGAHIHFQHSTGNNSPIGRQATVNTINILNWQQFVIAHEIAHTLGFWHEQCRSNRGSYIYIVTANIKSGNAGNFCIDPPLAGFYGPYDFDSTMHYGGCFFTIYDTGPNPCPNAPSPATFGGQTIYVYSPNQSWQNQIGQQTHLSDWDETNMSFLYPQANWRFMDSTYFGTQVGTFFQPYNNYANAYNQTPNGGRLVILRSGTYGGNGLLNKPMTIQAPQGATLTP